MKPWIPYMITGVLALMLGTGYGIGVHWPVIQENVFPGEQIVTWQDTGVDYSRENLTASIEDILAVTPPAPNAPPTAWMEFAHALDSIEGGNRHGNHGITSPLLPFFAYIARHNPETFYKLLRDDRISDWVFTHFLQVGLLEDWPERHFNPRAVVLKKPSAVLRLAVTEGVPSTRERIQQTMFDLARDKDMADDFRPSLSVLRFAMAGMSVSERKMVIDTLLNGPYQVNPNGVEKLVDMKGVDNNRLLSLIRKHGDLSQSRGSYMTTGALLGGKAYVEAMLDDLKNNDDQSSHIYCAACGIIMTTDGLIGDPAVRAAKHNRLDVVQTSDSPPFILKHARDQGNKNHGNR